MKIEERIKYLSEWVEYLKSKNSDELEPTQKQDLIILEETIKDLKAFETIIINSAIIIYDYLR